MVSFSAYTCTVLMYLYKAAEIPQVFKYFSKSEEFCHSQHVESELAKHININSLTPFPNTQRCDRVTQAAV